MAESEVCADCGRLAALQLVDPPSPAVAGNEGTVVKIDVRPGCLGDLRGERGI